VILGIFAYPRNGCPPLDRDRTLSTFLLTRLIAYRIAVELLPD
jgi:hypothetical protein